MVNECAIRGWDEYNPNCNAFREGKTCGAIMLWEEMVAGSYSRCWGSSVMDGYLSLPLVLSAGLRIAVGLPVASGALLQDWGTLTWTAVMQNQTCCEPVGSFRECFITSHSHFQTIMPDIIANIHSWVSMDSNEFISSHHIYTKVHHIRGGFALWEIKPKVFHSHTKRTCRGHQDFVNTAVGDMPML